MTSSKRSAATAKPNAGETQSPQRFRRVLRWTALLTVILSFLNFGVGVLYSDGDSYEIRVGQCTLFVMYGPRPPDVPTFVKGLYYPTTGGRLLLPDSLPELKSLSFSDIETPIGPHFRQWGSINMALIPLWPLSLLAIVYLAVSHYRRKRRRKEGCCAKCGYDLTGNVSGICPECGKTLEA